MKTNYLSHFKLRFGSIFFLIILPILLLAVISMYFFQHQTVKNKYDFLVHDVEVIAQMISNVAQFDLQYSREKAFNYNTLQATLSQVQASFKTFNKNNLQLEYLIGEKKNNRIEFVAFSKTQPPAIRLNEVNLAVPMRKALSGESGIIIERDYLGNKVVAAYHPIADTPLGLVIKQPFQHHFESFSKAIMMMIMAVAFLTFFIFLVLRKVTQHTNKMIASGEERFRDLIESGDNWIWEVNSQGVYTYSSHQVKEMLGYHASDIIGTTPFDYMDSNQAELVKNTFFDIAAHKAKIIELLNINRHKDGTEVYLITNGTPFFDESGNLLGYRGSDRNITPLWHKQKKIESMAFYDSLTGLANRNSCYERIAEELEYTKRNNIISALLFLDLDGFKYVNDSLGHEQGDELLRIVSQRLLKEMRRFDMVGRLGGDEFIILSRGEKEQSEACYQYIDSLTRRLIDTVNVPVKLENDNVHVGVSIGVVLIPQDGSTVEELTKRADSAMYKAKHIGKNCSVFYKQEFQVAADLILTLKHELLEAFNNNELTLYYQHQYDCDGVQILGYEALIRWEHGEKGLISPDKFLPYMEQIGFLKQLDRWVVERMCHDYTSFQALTDDDATISINLSASSFENEEFIDYLNELLLRFNIDPGRIILEITENMLLKKASGKNEILTQIKKTGCQLALDDFGTGYSSLAYLSQLEFDVIKIDLSFIQGIDVSSIDRKICKLIIQLAKDLEVKVVAEGVETQSQLEFVRKYGVDVIQGYIYSHPEALQVIFKN